MRKRFKVLASFLAAVMILSSLSVIVFADNEVEKSGSVSYYDYDSRTTKTAFDYQLYSNGDFKCQCYYHNISFSDLDDEILNSIIHVELDFANIEYYYPYITISGNNCNAEGIEILGLEDSYFQLWMDYFPYADEIDIPETASFEQVLLIGLGITSIDMLDNTDVEDLTFRYCNNLLSCEVPTSVKDLYFDDCSCLTEVVVNASLDYLHITECSSLKGISSNSSIERISWHSNDVSEIVVPNYNRYCRIGGENLTKVTLSYGIESIYDRMFSDLYNLSEVIVPSTLTSIQYRAFKNCESLKSITLPSSVKDIDNYAFASTGLESFTFPSSLINVQYKVFENCKSLKSVTIPTSVECIDATAFAGCTALTDVYYQGTEAQWNQIMFDPEDVSVSKIFNNATIHFNVQTGWSKSGNTWYYYDETGSQAKGWKEIKDKWYYFDNDGAMQTGWKQVNNKWYYFNSDGDMATGWKKANNNWYYLDSEGAMKTGWLQSGSNWYYLNSDGEMVTGWKQINSKWYYFSDGGEMVTGWKSSGGKWYYFSDDGDMATGWIEDDGEWYYLKSDGSMASNEYCDGYWLNSSGIWSYKYKASWRQNSTGWWYGDETGWYAKDETLVIDGVSYDFDGAGYLA